jgi:hypothetical protein
MSVTLLFGKVEFRLHENAENADRSKSPPLNMFLGPVLHEKSIAAISGGS